MSDEPNSLAEQLEAMRRHIRKDERLLRQVEQTLMQIKVAEGLSDEHASVLAAVRIRLTGDPGKKLEDVLSAAGDLGGPGLEDLFTREETETKGSLEDLLGKPKPKPEWPSG
jgi:hypothetical protein